MILEYQKKTKTNKIQCHTNILGTYNYLAPELEKGVGEKYYNNKIDIYAFGV